MTVKGGFDRLTLTFTSQLCVVSSGRRFALTSVCLSEPPDLPAVNSDLRWGPV